LHKELQSKQIAIAGIFIDAVNRHDGERIMQLAKAVWFFKDKREPNMNLADRERTILLFLKTILGHSGEKMTIRQVAQFMSIDDFSDGKQLKIPPDGFSALRRKCRELNIPLKPSRKISSQ